MTRLLTWIWQLPQNLIAILIIKVVYTEMNSYCSFRKYKKTKFYQVLCISCFMDNFSLGDYIFISEDNWYWNDKLKIRLAYGYVLSSRILGPFWIPFILIPRILYAFYDPTGYYLKGFYTDTFARYLSRKS